MVDEDPAVDRRQQSTAHEPTYDVVPQPGSHQLRAAHDPVLGTSEGEELGRQRHVASVASASPVPLARHWSLWRTGSHQLRWSSPVIW
ncbi:hypothetical protein [Nocardioides daphniae]|uniref:hypothetical protein n=1 Tax=Nocardioides daphniae TaxID=402297 RepID=UPI0013153B37|nr:hypothetical protein [Nocardioides daphniae]